MKNLLAKIGGGTKLSEGNGWKVQKIGEKCKYIGEKEKETIALIHNNFMTVHFWAATAALQGHIHRCYGRTAASWSKASFRFLTQAWPQPDPGCVATC